MSKSDVEMGDAEKLHNGSGGNVPESECKVIDTKVEREEPEVPCAAAATEDVNQGENGGENVNKVTEEVPCAAADSVDVKNLGENGGEDVNKVAEEVPCAAADSEDVKNQGENGGEDVNKVTEEVPCAVAASEDVNQGENGGEDVNKVIEEVPCAAAASEDVNQGENGREDVNKVIDEVKDKVNVKTETEVEDQTKLVNEASGEEDMNKSMDEVTDKIDVKTEVEDQTNPVNETSEPAKELDSGITINESHDEALTNTETPAEAQTAAIIAVEKQCDVKNEVVEHDDTDSAVKEDEPTKNDPVDEIHGKDVEKRPNEDAVEKPKEMGKDTHDTEHVASEMMVEMENADSGNVSLEIKQLPTEISANNESQRQEAELGDVRPGEDEEMEDAVQFDKEQVDKEHGVKSLTTSHETDGNEKTFESSAKPDAEESSLANQHEPFTPNALVRCSSEKNADHGGETAKTVFSLAAQPFMGDDDDGTPEDQAAFMKALEHFCRERAMDFKPPKFYGHPLNCLKLWRAVIRLGGYDRVTGSKLWRQVGESFHPPKTCTTVSWTFRIFYEKSLLEFERHKTQSGELQLPIIMLPEVSGADVEGNGFQGSGSGPGRARRDSATRAMQGWHAQRLGAGEVGDPVTKEKNLNNMAKNEKNLKSISSLKQKRPNEIEQSNKAARTDVSKPLVPSVVDVGPPADWVKISVRQAKDCFEVYALVPGLLREEVRVQSDPAGRVVITGQPEQIDNPWGITPFKKIINLPARIHPAHTSAVVSLHGRLYVRLPFEQPI